MAEGRTAILRAAGLMKVTGPWWRVRSVRWIWNRQSEHPMSERLDTLKEARDRMVGERDAHAKVLAAPRILRNRRKKPQDRIGASEPRKCDSSALMRAGAESEMPVRRAADVEIFGIGELGGIAIRSTNAQCYRRARRHRDAAEFDRLDRHAVAELVGTFESQHFFHGGLDPPG